jgi:hypothetical protein
MISGHMYRRGGHETGESMTGHSTRCGITMQQSPGISQGNVHSAWRQQQQQQLSHHPIPSHRAIPSQAGSLLYCFTHKEGFNSALRPWPIAVTSVSESLSMSRAGSGCSLGPGVLPHVSLPHQSCGTALCLYLSSECSCRFGPVLSDVLLWSAQLQVQSMGRVGVEAVPVV